MKNYVAKLSATAVGAACFLLLLTGAVLAEENYHIPPDAPLNQIDPNSDADTVSPQYAPEALHRALLSASQVETFAPYNFDVREIKDDFQFVTRGKVKDNKVYASEAFVSQHFVITPPADPDKGRIQYDIWIRYRWMDDSEMDILSSVFDDAIRRHPELPETFIDNLSREEIEFHYEKITATKNLKRDKRRTGFGQWTERDTNFVRSQPVLWDKLKNTYVAWKRHPNIYRGSFYNIPQLVVVSGTEAGLIEHEGGAYLVTVDYQMSNPWEPFAFVERLRREVANWLTEKDNEQDLYHHDYYEPVRPIGP